MTQEEINKLRIGDVIFDMTRKEAYHLVKIEDGCVYYEGTPHWGSIPKTSLLNWNIVSLMRDRVVYCKDTVSVMTPYVKQIQEVLLQLCPGGNVAITKDWWKFNENKMHNGEAFEIGDVVTDGTSTFKIVDIQGDNYITEDGDKVCFYIAHRYYTPIED